MELNESDQIGDLPSDDLVASIPSYAPEVFWSKSAALFELLTNPVGESYSVFWIGFYCGTSADIYIGTRQIGTVQGGTWFYQVKPTDVDGNQLKLTVKNEQSWFQVKPYYTLKVS